MWFRRDLRLRDNPALTDAVSNHDRVLPLFVIDRRLMETSGTPRRWFLAGCLADLHDRTDGALVIRTGPPATEVSALARLIGADAVYCAEDYNPYGTARDQEVSDALAADDVPLRRIGSPYVVPPGVVRTTTGDPYRVFTPFRRAWSTYPVGAPLGAPRGVTWLDGVESDGLPATPTVDADLPTPGEDAAAHRLGAFLDHDLAGYHENRDRPDRDSTSRLSPYLRWGCLHPRQIIDRLGRGKDGDTLRSELAWRDFYADVLHHHPGSARSSLDEAMAGIELDTGSRAEERFAAWTQGRTGVPIVDAGMRQLLGEGWMHNRVRMIVASYLVKDLHVDWTRGARHFMAHLVDGDLASNQHGWQWVAGTGTDAAPYFRIFNPTTQSRRFDPDGDYIRRWVPELREVEGKVVHEPWVLGRDLFSPAVEGYPPPLVDHAVERDEALRRWRAATGRS